MTSHSSAVPREAPFADPPSSAPPPDGLVSHTETRIVPQSVAWAVRSHLRVALRIIDKRLTDGLPDGWEDRKPGHLRLTVTLEEIP